MAWVVTAVVVQGVTRPTTAPSGARGRWRRTRSRSPRWRCSGLVFVGVPALINSGRLAAYGAPVSAHVAATIQIAVTAGGAIVPGWALAIATRTLPRFLAAVGGLSSSPTSP